MLVLPEPLVPVPHDTALPSRPNDKVEAEQREEVKKVQGLGGQGLGPWANTAPEWFDQKNQDETLEYNRPRVGILARRRGRWSERDGNRNERESRGDASASRPSLGRLRRYRSRRVVGCAAAPYCMTIYPFFLLPRRPLPTRGTRLRYPADTGRLCIVSSAHTTMGGCPRSVMARCVLLGNAGHAGAGEHRGRMDQSVLFTGSSRGKGGWRRTARERKRRESKHRGEKYERTEALTLQRMQQPNVLSAQCGSSYSAGQGSTLKVCHIPSNVVFPRHAPQSKCSAFRAALYFGYIPDARELASRKVAACSNGFLTGASGTSDDVAHSRHATCAQRTPSLTVAPQTVIESAASSEIGVDTPTRRACEGLLARRWSPYSCRDSVGRS
ncbi:hypothetical protein B0H19DRAFT_1311368 [Mycena capillaripes]|nr:hypothetical protein B0H19DRAFT_1311368 [Mycena capillaripes]